MISKLAKLAIEVAELSKADCVLQYPAQPEELVELEGELQNSPLLANPMLKGFAWNFAPNVSYVLVYVPEEDVAVTVYVLTPPQTQGETHLQEAQG